MSVFYNLEKCNSKGEGEMELRFAENSFEEILDRQDKYEVAVNRFKIPVQNVDLFRLYPNRYYCGTRYNANSLNATNNEARDARNALNDLVHSSAAYKKDPHLKDPTNPEGLYQAVNSSVDFCNILNRQIWNSYVSNMINIRSNTLLTYAQSISTAGDAITNPSANPATDGGTGNAPAAPNVYFRQFEYAGATKFQAGDVEGASVTSLYNIMKPIQTFTPVAKDYANTGGLNPSVDSEKNLAAVCAVWEVRLLNFDTFTTIGGGGAGTFDYPDISALRLNLKINYVGSDTAGSDTFVDDVYIDITPNWSGFLVSEMNNRFPNGIIISSFGTIPLSKIMEYPVGVNNINKIPNFCLDNREDFDLFLGKSCYRPDINGLLNITLCMAIDGDEASQWTMLPYKNNLPSGQRENMKLRIVVDNSPLTLRKVPDNTTFPKPDSSKKHEDIKYSLGFNYFSYDEETKLITYNDYYFWRNHSLRVYLSSSLASLMGFGIDKIPIELTQRIFKPPENVVPFDPIPFTEEEVRNKGVVNGGFMFGHSNTDSEYDRFRIKPDGLLKGLCNTITERASSDYKRRFLWGLAVTSNSISNKGEYTGNGQARRKLLTDFIIDPSSDEQDYMIYEPSNFRFYSLNSQLPLRDLIVSVFYIDMNLNLQPLYLDPNYSATIKLEFKPVNYLENYVSNN